MRRLGLGAAAVATAGFLALAPAATAQAHSLDSSTIAVRLGEDSAEATISIALETLDAALGTSYATADELSTAAVDEIVSYIDEHLAVTGADGSAWAESYADAAVESVEGIQSFSVDVAFDAGDADTSSFVIDYDAVIEADDTHEAVVVLTDTSGEISTAGVLTASDETLAIGDAVEPGLADMIAYGFQHVLAGADHLLFLITLLLVAPLVATAARRWTAGPTFRRSIGAALALATAFTAGHSVTLIAAALGWISLPSTLVEILVAASVAVAAIHAIRPIVRRGEIAIAGLFGLVHGLAFAGILNELGFIGGRSVMTLLAFNVGVELAQLTAVALVFPSLYVISRTSWERVVRVGIAALAGAAAVFWILDRAGVVTDPLAGLESAVTTHAWAVAAALGAIASCAWVTTRLRSPGPPRGHDIGLRA